MKSDQPILNWRGRTERRPGFLPDAQLRQVHGDAAGGWRNRLYLGNNFDVLHILRREFAGRVDLIYMDPPYNSGKHYQKRIQCRGIKAKELAFDVFDFGDVWPIDQYLQFVHERLGAARALLAPTGSIIIQCDWHAVHQIRCIADEWFGAHNFRNEIVWCTNAFAPSMATYSYRHENLLWYTASDHWTFNQSHPGAGGDGLQGPDGQNIPADGLRDWWADRTVQRQWSVDEADRRSNCEEYLYPTQKPVGFAERVVSAHSHPGDLVLDCFGGAGTFQMAALRLGRRFIGIDQNSRAIHVALSRLIGSCEMPAGEELPGVEIYDTGSSVFANGEIGLASGSVRDQAEPNPDKDDPSLNNREGGFGAPREGELGISVKRNERCLCIEHFSPETVPTAIRNHRVVRDDWRALAAMIFIDWAHDGVILRPSVTDVPRGEDVVKGTYKIPDHAANIRLRIVDIAGAAREISICPP